MSTATSLLTRTFLFLLDNDRRVQGAVVALAILPRGSEPTSTALSVLDDNGKLWTLTGPQIRNMTEVLATGKTVAETLDAVDELATGGGAATPGPVTLAERATLRAIGGGCDVFSPSIAADIRRLDVAHPGLVEIGESPREYGPKDVHPYFGVALTDRGLAETVNLDEVYRLSEQAQEAGDNDLVFSCSLAIQGDVVELAMVARLLMEREEERQGDILEAVEGLERTAREAAEAGMRADEDAVNITEQAAATARTELLALLGIRDAPGGGGS